MLFSYLKEKMLATPDCIIRDEQNCMTFRELIAYAEDFGSSLKQDKYGILCKTELNTARALMACLYARKTAVLLSDRYGKQHSEKIISAIKLSYIITDDGIQKIDDEQPEAEDLSDVAFILCTSGTTGNPKGAMVTEDNLLTNLNDIAKYFDIQPGWNILIARSLYHCAVLTGEFFISLIKGLNIYFLNESYNPAVIIDAVRKHSIHVMCATPSLFYHMCRLIKKQKEFLPLSVIACSGECMTETVAREMRVCFPDTKIYNVYGLTEASPRVSYLPPDLFDRHPTSVGIFLDSVTGKIEDDELLIKGSSIMKGYYCNPDYTAKVIRDGWFCTGDSAEIRDGLLYIKGRKDNLIIRGGMNIYPQEIENAVKQDKRISEAYAFGVSDKDIGQKIHLWVESSSCDKKDVFEICKSLLPGYQMPDVIEIVDKIPKNASGKIVRKRSMV